MREFPIPTSIVENLNSVSSVSDLSSLSSGTVGSSRRVHGYTSSVRGM